MSFKLGIVLDSNRVATHNMTLKFSNPHAVNGRNSAAWSVGLAYVQAPHKVYLGSG